MNNLQPKKHPQKITKKRLTNEQVKLLETSFNFNNKLDSTRKSHLAQELGVPARQIAIWYQNKRARWRNQSLETEYKALQHRLERVSSDKSRLEREVERLKGELEKAKELLVSSKTMNFTSLPSFSSSCDEVGSSSLLGDHGDFYVCFDNHQFDHKSNGHDFFGCGFSYGVWAPICKWCKIDPLFALEFKDLLQISTTMKGSSWAKKAVHGIAMITMWVIWKTKNDKVFQRKEAKVIEVVVTIKSLAFLWLWNRSRFKTLLWKEWVPYPLYML